MSSSQVFLPSSQLSQASAKTTRRCKSKYTYKQLNLLGQSSTSCPLRVIAHIDLDAFYAQCEGIRLGIDEEQALAVQQWQGLIAINYPARKYGLTRHIEINEAKKLCPDLILQHVATWREGDQTWQYHPDAFANIATHKVSLDPYRRESRRILACIKEHLPSGPLQRVEKASIDEVFLDLSAQVHAELLKRFPDLCGPPPYNDFSEHLPSPPTTVLDWEADALVDLDETNMELEDPDWDDIATLIGSQIVRGVRAAIREKLKYTCSAGIARNKMIAKLGSAYKKPNQQTIVRNRAVQHFLSDFKFTKIRNLGGKLGEDIVAKFNTETVKDLLIVSVEQLKLKLGDDTGTWVYQILRGEDSSEVNPRTQIKSMLSAKSFRPSITSSEQALRWLCIFVADIYSRLVEEGVTENKRRPKTINLHYKHAGQSRSRQAPIPGGSSIDEKLLNELAKSLLTQIVSDGRAWPCYNLSLSVGGFEDGVVGNRGIGGFLVRGEDARAMNATSLFSSAPSGRSSDDGQAGRLSKKPRTDRPAGQLDNFFHRHNSLLSSETSLDSNEGDRPCLPGNSPKIDSTAGEDETEQGSRSARTAPFNAETEYVCPQCRELTPLLGQAEHEDWHFAAALQQEQDTSEALARQSNTSTTTTSAAGVRKLERGQKKLAFG